LVVAGNSIAELLAMNLTASSSVFWEHTYKNVVPPDLEALLRINHKIFLDEWLRYIDVVCSSSILELSGKRGD